jgi:hypothetical protein
MPESFRTSTLKEEGIFQVSKWLSCQILLSLEEMQNLIDDLPDFFICVAGQISTLEDISRENFLATYSNYVDGIKDGKLIDEAIYRPSFSSVFTTSLDCLYKIEFPGDKHMLRVCKPVVQLQAHRMHYSKLESKFRPMIFGSESISWGIQFSYPQIFQDNKTKEIVKCFNNPKFPNGTLYHRLQKWMRKNTIPTPFLEADKHIISPIRIGKGCLPWINQHPQLINKGLKVDVS